MYCSSISIIIVYLEQPSNFYPCSSLKVSTAHLEKHISICGSDKSRLATHLWKKVLYSAKKKKQVICTNNCVAGVHSDVGHMTDFHCWSICEYYTMLLHSVRFHPQRYHMCLNRIQFECVNKLKCLYRIGRSAWFGINKAFSHWHKTTITVAISAACWITHP